MMTEPTPTYQTEPSEREQQTAARLYVMYKEFHEMGLNLQRQLEAMNALPSGTRLFLTRQERRGRPE